MASKSSSPGPSAPAAAPSKQSRSRKAVAQQQDSEVTAGRAGSAGGIVLEREKESKTKSNPINTKGVAKSAKSDHTAEVPPNTANKARRKPRKLNKDTSSTTISTTTATVQPSPNESVITDTTSTAELEALKSRVRGLEAKVEELYKNGTGERSNRSPRRRGKGRKNSSAQQVPTLATSATRSATTKTGEAQDARQVEEEEADEELVRLEDELEVARQDLARYRPRNRRSRSGQTSIDDEVEEIPRDTPGVENVGTTRQVTLSGSYRIPLPASVNTEDLKTIQSGVSAAQNVARSFLEQRRAAAAVREQQSAGASRSTSSSTTATSSKRPKPAKSVSSSMEVVEGGDKQSWSEWFGGYSLAISRAVKSIEHEAAVESQKVTPGAGGGGAGEAGKKKGSGLKGTGKRPPAKAKMSSDQVQGLMS